jgi:hypothetical protein
MDTGPDAEKQNARETLEEPSKNSKSQKRNARSQASAEEVENIERPYPFSVRQATSQRKKPPPFQYAKCENRNPETFHAFMFYPYASVAVAQNHAVEKGNRVHQLAVYLSP